MAIGRYEPLRDGSACRRGGGRLRSGVVSPLALAAVTVAVAGASFLAAPSASASEAAFLQSLTGRWVGDGFVQVRTNMPDIRVSCTFDSRGTASSLDLDGVCRALMVVTKEVSAHLKTNGDDYTGVYRGSRTGPARLSGVRDGNRLDLEIGWAGVVNGDRKARMTVAYPAENRMQLTTIDEDPKSGKPVVTSRIDLVRK